MLRPGRAGFTERGVKGRIGRVARLAALAVALSASACSRTPSPSGFSGVVGAEERRPHILFVLIDTLRADRLGPYGHRGGLMRFAEELAREGVTFEHCVSAAPWTLPSIASIFTGYYPSVHKTTKYVSPDAKRVENRRDEQGFVSVLPDEDFVTLAEALRDVGYQTLGVSANRFVSRKFGFAQGFDQFYDDFEGDTVSGSLVNAAVFDQLASADPARPIFLYVHYMDVHGPYNAEPRFMDRLMEDVEKRADKRPLKAAEIEQMFPYLRPPPPGATDPTRHERLKGYRDYWEARYDAGVAAMDFQLGELRAFLQSRGMWDDAYVVFVADHGESLCEHGMWDHGHTLYEPEIHVPLILRWREKLPPARRVPGVVRTIDLLPTLLEQVRAPVSGSTQGASLVSRAVGASQAAVVPALSESLKGRPTRFQQTVVEGPWKLVRRVQVVRGENNRPVATGEHEVFLYDLSSRGGEDVDLAARHPDRVRSMERFLLEQNRINDTLKPDLVIEHAAADASKLAGLGYVGSTPGDDEGTVPDSQPSSASSPAGERP